MKDYLESKKNRWYARLAIPKDIRHFYKNNKLRHFQSTGTADKAEAQEIAMGWVLQWKREFKEYRALLTAQSTPNNQNEANPVGNSEAIEIAMEVKTQLEEAVSRDISSNVDIEPWNSEEELLKIALHELVELEHSKGNIASATAIHSVALSGQTPLEPFVNKWASSLHNVPKTIDQRLSDVRLLLERFSTVESVTIQEARQWIAYLTTTKQQNGKPRSSNSINRILIGARLFWDYLQDVGAAPFGIKPFEMPKYIKRDREKVKTDRVRRLAYTLEECVMIYREAVIQHDQQFVDLIHIGMYTGARINEICSLSLVDCSETSISIRTSKTVAGIREIPVHNQLKDTIKRLLASSHDGYLISGLSSNNKYARRSAAIGHKYSRFKTSLGFGPQHVFHSFRHTIATHILRNGFSKELIAATVGHVSDDFTVDTYASDAFTLAQKAEAINSVQYSF